MVNISTNINNTNNPKPSNTKKDKNTTTYYVGIPDPGFGQAQKSGRVLKQLIGSQPSPL
jgi:hypothetical protein